jgi:hypothetical protein
MMSYILTVSQSKVEIKRRVLLVSLDEALDRKVFWPWLFKSQGMEGKRISFSYRAA